jgi:hypothetical protein
MSDTAYDRAVERIDRAAAGVEREHRLDGLHPLIEKSEPESHGDGVEGVRNAASGVSERRSHPVVDEINSLLEDGVRVRKIPGADGNPVDDKATLRSSESELRRVAAWRTDERKLDAADIRERSRAFNENRPYNIGIALADSVLDAAAKEFPPEMTSQEFEALGDPNSPTHDPDKYQRGLLLKERLAAANETLQQQPTEQQSLPQQVEANRQAQEQARVAAEAEQSRLEHDFKTREAEITSTAQQLHGLLQQTDTEILARFPELRNSTPEQVAQHYIQTGQQQRLHEMLSAAQYRQNILNQGAAIGNQWNQLHSEHGHAQKQQQQATYDNVSKSFADLHPELKTRDGYRRTQDAFVDSMRADGYSDEYIASIASWVKQQAPEAQWLATQWAYDRANAHEAKKMRANAEKTTMDHLKKLPPVQKPGVAGSRGYADSQEYYRLNASLDQATGLRAAKIGAELLAAKRRAARR